MTIAHATAQETFNVDVQSPGDGVPVQTGPAVLAGSGATSVWNSLYPTTITETLQDSTGLPTPVAVSINCPNSNSVATGSPFDPATADLMTDYGDAPAGQGPISVSIGGLTAGASFTLVIYASSEVAGLGENLTLTGATGGNTATTLSVSGASRRLSAGLGVAYNTFTGIVGPSGIITFTVASSAGNKAYLNGFQIQQSVAVPVYAARKGAATFTNDIGLNEDPSIKYYNGKYCYASANFNSTITIFISTTIKNLLAGTGTGNSTTTINDPLMSESEAPDIDLLTDPTDGKLHWFVYASDVQNVNNITVYESATSDPGSTYTRKANFPGLAGYDQSILKLPNGQLYLLFCDTALNSAGSIVALSNPWTAACNPVSILSPNYPWENFIQEAPCAFVHNGTISWFYSTNFYYNNNYEEGIATAAIGSDLLNPASWTKNPVPPFQQNGITKVYGPGSICTWTSPDNTETWFAQSGIIVPGQGPNLNRYIWAQPILGWNADNTPNLGIPLGTTTPVSVPSGEGTLSGTTATPTLSVASGTYNTPQTVTLADASSNSTIYYSTDGSTPGVCSFVYTGPISVASSQVLKTVAISTNRAISPVASATYTISAATPTFSPAAGSYTKAQTVTINDATSGAAIYYTTDGSTPTIASNAYSGPITVNGSQTLKAIAVFSTYDNSSAGTATYTISLTNTVATPTFSPAAGNYSAAQSVTIKDATSGANIYYTTDGSTPTTSSPVYSGPVAVSGGETIKAIATASGKTTSNVGAAVYSINILADGSFEAGTPSTSTVPGWKVTGNVSVESDYGASPGNNPNYAVGASDGTQALAYNTGNSAPNGVVSQTFATTLGRVYTVSFDFGKYGNPAGTAALGVTVSTSASTLLSQTVSNSNGSDYGLNNGLNEVFSHYSFTFTGDGNTATISFADQSTNFGLNYDTALDNVVIQ